VVLPPFLSGRDFDWRDNSQGPGVTILSQSLAMRLFGKSNPVGQRVRFGLDPSRAGLEVIGVVHAPISYSVQMFGWFSADAARASL
jgi:MacB-like periplasmic core domain